MTRSRRPDHAAQVRRRLDHLIPLHLAASMLGLDEGEARRWLRRRHLVTVVAGRHLVSWLAAVEAIRGPIPDQLTGVAARDCRRALVAGNLPEAP